MEPSKVSATDLRIKTRDLIERVRYKGEHLVIHNFGRPMAVLISYEEYMRLVKEAIGVDHSGIDASSNRARQELVLEQKIQS